MTKTRIKVMQLVIHVMEIREIWIVKQSLILPGSDGQGRSRFLDPGSTSCETTWNLREFTDLSCFGTALCRFLRFLRFLDLGILGTSQELHLQFLALERLRKSTKSTNLAWPIHWRHWMRQRRCRFGFQIFQASFFVAWPKKRHAKSS